jgi:hypothetical protein
MGYYEKSRMKIIKRWKFLRTGLKSENGGLKWKKGEWQKVTGELELCRNGLHCSKNAYDAFSYVQGEILAEVECRGKHLFDENKECWEEQRVVKTYRWTKKDSVRLAIYSAESCLKNYEKIYPKDKRPRQAIEATKRWLKTGSKKGLSAACSAARSAESAARSAESAARSAGSAACSAACSAESATWSATWSAESAARSAESAARSATWSATWSAESAARSAGSATWSATWSATINKIQKYFKKIVKEKQNGI